jgi:CheY-like chemotaxis protein
VTLPLTTLSRDEQLHITTTTINTHSGAGVAAERRVASSLSLEESSHDGNSGTAPCLASQETERAAVLLPHAGACSVPTSSPFSQSEPSPSLRVPSEDMLLEITASCPNVIDHDSLMLQLSSAPPSTTLLKSPILLPRLIRAQSISRESVASGSTTLMSPKVALPMLSTQSSPLLSLPQLIMLVDDSSVNLRLCERMLRVEGYTCFETAENGLKALERLILLRHANNMPIMLFLDLHMPIMDGIETCKHLRQLGFTLPICALTAATNLEARQQCQQVGFTCMLIKPVSRSQMQETLVLLLPQL